MKRLNRYIVSSVIKFLAITELAGMIMFFIIEFFEHMDKFTASSKNFVYGVYYLLLRIPYYLNLILPLSFLISMLIFLILMVRNNEMITVRTSGISTASLMKPLIVLSIALIAFSFILAELVVPVSLSSAEYVYRIKIKKEEPYVFFKNDRIWFKRGNKICNIDFYDIKNDKIKNLTLIELSDNFSIQRRIDAKEGIWIKGHWLFMDVVERTFDSNGIKSKKTYAQMRDIIREEPSVFKIVEKNPEEMGYNELKRYINKLKQDGHSIKRYLVDLYNKISSPFVNLIMVFAAFAVGLRYSKTKHISKGIFSGISVGIIYWFFHSIALSFGYSEIFPPLFAAWFANMLFFSLGIIGIVTLRT